ncbi:uncharacterized protein ACR2FA_005298 [Aphomia sociella]
MASIDVEQFIQEIKSRPLLYNKTLPQYTNRRRKENMWIEICSKMIPNWETIEETDKDIISKDIQLKWKHIRDNFRREFHIQNKIKFGQVTKTKRIYRYYKQLQFLIPFINYPDSIISGRTSQQETEDDSDSTPIASKRSKTIAYQRKNRRIENLLKKNKKNTLSQADASVENHTHVSGSKCSTGQDDSDEDRSFCLSLVKSLKKMSDEAKLNAKIDILNIIRRFSFPQSDYNQVYTDPLPPDPLPYSQLPNQSSQNAIMYEKFKNEYSPDNSQNESFHPIRRKRTRNHRNVRSPSRPGSAASSSANDRTSPFNSVSLSSSPKCYSPTNVTILGGHDT